MTVEVGCEEGCRDSTVEVESICGRVGLGYTGTGVRVDVAIFVRSVVGNGVKSPDPALTPLTSASEKIRAEHETSRRMAVAVLINGL